MYGDKVLVPKFAQFYKGLLYLNFVKYQFLKEFLWMFRKCRKMYTVTRSTYLMTLIFGWSILKQTLFSEPFFNRSISNAL